MVKLLYGTFAGLGSHEDWTSLHHSHCNGLKVEEVIFNHEHFNLARSANYSGPSYSVTRQVLPDYVLVLENSVSMNSAGQWDYIRAACRDLILNRLPSSVRLGLVLFNGGAHIAHPVITLGNTENSKTRQGLSLQIKSRHNLSPVKESCVKCAVDRAVEALSATSGSDNSREGLVILIRSAQSPLQDTDYLRNISVKHKLRLFFLNILPGDRYQEDTGLDMLAHQTGGESMPVSFFGRPSLQFYISLVESFTLVAKQSLLESSVVVSDIKRFH